MRSARRTTCPPPPPKASSRHHRVREALHRFTVSIMDHWGVTEVGEKRRGIRVGLLKTKALNLRECGDQECTEPTPDLIRRRDDLHEDITGGRVSGPR